MTDDYLWDGSGEADREVARLERALGRLRAPLPPAPALPNVGTNEKRSAGTIRPFPTRAYAGFRFLAPTLAAAASIALMLAATWQSLTFGGSWEVARMAGEPRVASVLLGETGRIAV